MHEQVDQEKLRKKVSMPPLWPRMTLTRMVDKDVDNSVAWPCNPHESVVCLKSLKNHHSKSQIKQRLAWEHRACSMVRPTRALSSLEVDEVDN
jgi:hypothetical protein